MSSRVLSRFLPVAEGDVSVYEGIKRGAARKLDLESQQRLPEHEPFRDEDEDPEGLLYDQQEDSDAAQSATVSPERRGADKWLGQGKRRAEEDEDVPESLLLDDKRKHAATRQLAPRPVDSSQVRTEAQWRATQQQHGLHASLSPKQVRPRSARPRSSTGTVTQRDPQAAAMWQYTNAQNLDAFLLEVYQYYTGHGMVSILLSQALGLLSELFVFSFAMFLTTCIDYSKVPSSKSTSEVLIPKCMAKASWLKNAALFVFVIYWCTSLAKTIGSVRRLSRMQTFYNHALGITDQDIQTVTWIRVVNSLVKLHNANVTTADMAPAVKKYVMYSKPQQRMNAETIANRLMRQANYYVAMYNKEILDFTLPLPFVGHRQFYSKSLEWAIDFCLTNFIFDEQGSIRPFCLDVRNRKVLVQALQVRLQFAALTSILVAPFNILRFCIVYFFRYYTEFSRNPSKASARSFTPFAEWKMREFNELDHLFERRLRQALQPANQYLRQFPKDKVDQVCRFIGFISGAIAAVLTIATLFDPELFLGFEVTPGRTAVFWLTLMVGIFGIAQGSLPDDDEVGDPVLHLKAVLCFTHYIPNHWKERLHTTEVRSEFSAMYQMKIWIFVEEILSLIVAPWILLRNAGKRSERIIDFFREQTVHVDGIGYQCNFAVFGFKKDPNAADPGAVLDSDGLRDDYYGLKDDKMAVSVNNSMQYYNHYGQRPHGRRSGWHPPPAWPPVLSPSAIAEEPEVAVARAYVSAKHEKRTRSGMLEQPVSRAGLGQPSPRQPAVDRRPAQHRDPLGKRAAVGSPDLQGVTESVMMRDDSDLHDLANPEKDTTESDTDADEDAGKVGKAGVLGMLYQYSKAQTEKGTGVRI
ncbi:autophagy protein atg9 [Elasticomyces elasticus]|nr:autophagy protein atg9 [Elasticomyces elasticus]